MTIIQPRSSLAGGAGAESLISVAVEAAAPGDPAIMSVSKYDFSILKIRPQLRELSP